MFTLECITRLVIICIAAYLLGSVNFAIIISRIVSRDDIRLHGSGNAGMTNMLRTYGKWPAICTALGDFSKAIAAVLISRIFDNNLSAFIPDAGYIAGIFVILGHMFPIYFRFKGGKGVMTGLGVIASVNLPIFLILLVNVLPLIIINRVISLASISGAVLFMTITSVWAFLFTDYPFYYSICSTIIGGLIIFVHSENIKRLMAGTENRLGKKK